MNFKSFFKKNIPNPYSTKSTLSDFEKKTKIIGAGLSGIIKILNNLVIVLIILIVLFFYFKVPINILFIILVVEVLLNLIFGFIKNSEVKSLYLINTDNDNNYKKVLIINEYYKLIGSIYTLISNIVNVGIIAFVFYEYILRLVVKDIPQSIFSRIDWIKYFILFFIIFRLYQFIISNIKFFYIKRIKENNDFAEIDREYLLVNKKIELFSFIFGIIVFSLVTFLVGLSLIFPIFFLIIGVIMTIFSLIEITKIKKVGLNTKNIDISLQPDIKKYNDELIIGYLGGIMKTGFGLFGFGSFGVGHDYYPENSIVVTNYRILLVQIPVTGGDKIIGDKKYVSQNFFYNRGEIKRRVDDIIKTNSISEILKITRIDILFNDIKNIILKNNSIIIEKISGEKLSYGFIDNAEDFKKILRNILKDKIIEKD